MFFQQAKDNSDIDKASRTTGAKYSLSLACDLREIRADVDFYR
jgi:hypothetical protein